MKFKCLDCDKNFYYTKEETSRDTFNASCEECGGSIILMEESDNDSENAFYNITKPIFKKETDLSKLPTLQDKASQPSLTLKVSPQNSTPKSQTIKQEPVKKSEEVSIKREVKQPKPAPKPAPVKIIEEEFDEEEISQISKGAGKKYLPAILVFSILVLGTLAFFILKPDLAELKSLGSGFTKEKSERSHTLDFKRLIKNGELAEKMNDWEDAVLYYEEANLLEPDQADILLKLGTLFNKQLNNFKLAENEFLRNVTINDDSESLFQLGLMYDERKDKEKAKQFLEKYLDSSAKSEDKIITAKKILERLK